MKLLLLPIVAATLASCSTGAGVGGPPPFPHPGLTSEYDPNHPLLVLTTRDYQIYEK